MREEEFQDVLREFVRGERREYIGSIVNCVHLRKMLKDCFNIQSSYEWLMSGNYRLKLDGGD